MKILITLYIFEKVSTFSPHARAVTARFLTREITQLPRASVDVVIGAQETLRGKYLEISKVSNNKLDSH